VTAIFIAVAAVVVSLVALVLGERRERKRLLAEERAERRAEKAEQRDDERARREQLEFQTTQQGRPTTDPATREPGADRAYRFRVTNIGKSPMTDLSPILVDAAGDICSEPTYLGAMQPGERTEFVLKVTGPADRDPLYLRYTWFDRAGFREHLSNVTVPSA
jgi:hypothetical protein